MPRISIIIPTYNRAELICETLESIRAQTSSDLETIVVDDGSEQDIPAALAPVSFPVTYQRITRSGQGQARNVGLELARGELIAFLDSDDLWRPRFLERMIGALDANPGADFVYCDYATFDSRGEYRPTSLPSQHKLNGSLLPELFETNFLCVGGLLFRRACFHRAGAFNPALPPVEDWDLWLRVARTCSAVYVDEPLVRIRVNPFNPSRNPAVFLPLNLRVLDQVERGWPEARALFRTPLRRRQVQTHLALARLYRSKGQLSPALGHLAQSIRYLVP